MSSFLPLCNNCLFNIEDKRGFLLSCGHFACLREWLNFSFFFFVKVREIVAAAPSTLSKFKFSKKVAVQKARHLRMYNRLDPSTLLLYLQVLSARCKTIVHAHPVCLYPWTLSLFDPKVANEPRVCVC